MLFEFQISTLERFLMSYITQGFLIRLQYWLQEITAKNFYFKNVFFSNSNNCITVFEVQLTIGEQKYEFLPFMYIYTLLKK